MASRERQAQMDKVYEQTLLYDFYGELLTERQKNICRMHLLEDWSLGEISEELKISRQGVHDALRRGLEALEEYEGKLHMVSRFLEVSRQLEELPGLAREGRLEEGIRSIREALKQ